MDTDGALKFLQQVDREVNLLGHAAAVLGWDQETYLPPSGIEERADQLALLQGIVHEKMTSPQVGEALSLLPAPRDEDSARDSAFLREWQRRYERAVKLPADLVTRMAHAASMGQAKWAEARKISSFPHFQPYLQEILLLSKESAEAIGYEASPYDALLDEYEPWMKSSDIASVFETLAEDLVPLSQAVLRAPGPRHDFLEKRFPREKQERFGRMVLEAMGFDSGRGRLDVTAHPFTTTLGADDVRITTRYNEDFFPTSFFGTVHEGGHALYEQGFGPAVRSTILAEATSLGIHESQSRFWENCIARSRPFWEHWYPLLQKDSSLGFDGISLDDFYKAVNRVSSSPIRVEADEVTYNLHIMLRFFLERDLFEGRLEVEDLPQAWNARSRELLGIDPENDAEGILQDIHWSMGAFGYFPTYALGNLYAAQFMQKLREDIPDIDLRLSAGDLKTPCDWLRKNIHVHGRIYPAAELCRLTTGRALDPKPFLLYLKEKYSTLYEL